MTVILGDCIEVMAGMDPESVDAIVTDPPYGLEFMGKEWDSIGVKADRRQPGDPTFHASGAGPFDRAKVRYGYGGKDVGPMQQAWHARWAEAAYRVAKPSAYLLAFGGTRTVHRMTVALEDAGWIIRDMLVWGYASGFPKSKASLKPAWEPIVMARKPGPLRDLAIDACRIAPPDDTRARSNPQMRGGNFGTGGAGSETIGDRGDLGRWPANIVLTDPIFDGGMEGVVGGGETTGVSAPASGPTLTGTSSSVARGKFNGVDATPFYGDSGTYSRFFLIPKADRADREPVLGGHGLDVRLKAGYSGGEGDGELTGLNERLRTKTERANVHPTVKPTDLMRHLVRLVTPTGGLVLDPFLGSGSTGLAAEMEGFPWIGIEREAEYVAIAEARLNGTQRGLGLEAI